MYFYNIWNIVLSKTAQDIKKADGQIYVLVALTKIKKRHTNTEHYLASKQIVQKLDAR